MLHPGRFKRRGKRGNLPGTEKGGAPHKALESRRFCAIWEGAPVDLFWRKKAQIRKLYDGGRCRPGRVDCIRMNGERADEG